MRRNKALSNSEFLARVREYLPMHAAIWETDSTGKPQPNRTANLVENTFFHFDSDAVQALSCAIEDIALEEASGSFLAAIQDFSHFNALKERYWQLAATLDEVEVIASGRTPGQNGHLKFCNAGRSPIKSFWMVLYQSKTAQILFLCQQANNAKAFEDRMFSGFYTFSGRVIDQARQDIADLLGGKCPELRQFGEMRAVDRAAKELKSEFAREQEALELAIKKLKSGSAKHRAESFLRDLNRSLQRLNQLKSRLPELIVGHKND